MRYIYPGSFDPVTLGHLDIIERAAKLCDELIVGVFVNPEKKGAFPPEIRVKLLKKCTQHIKNVKIVLSSETLSSIIKAEKCDAIIRGIRNVSDFDSERDRAVINKKLAEVDTLLLYSNGDLSSVSSSLIRELLYFGCSSDYYKELLPEIIIDDVIDNYSLYGGLNGKGLFICSYSRIKRGNY